MQIEGLVVEDDDRRFWLVKECLASAGFRIARARCQEEAQFVVWGKDYWFVLSDLDIPFSCEDGIPREAHGFNLLEELSRVDSPARPALIGMTDRASDDCRSRIRACLRMHELMNRGVVFTHKPVEPHDDELERVLKAAVTKRTHRLESTTTGLAVSIAQPDEDGLPTRFTGGELVIYPDRAELMGVKIIGDSGAGLSLKTLEVLDAKVPSGHWRGFSSNSLASRIEADSETTAINCVSTIRDNIVERLLKLRNITCNRDDVIGNDPVRGYHYRDSITVRRVRATNSLTLLTARASTSDDGVDRRDMILSILASRPLRVPELAAALDVAPKTVHRALGGLKRDGLVEFVGSPKTGAYRVKRPSRT